MKKLCTLILGMLAAGTLAAQSTIYIDPTYTGGSSDGTETAPYTHWKDVLPLQESNTYLQKRGTVCDTDTEMELKAGVTVGAYGDAQLDRPVINFTAEMGPNLAIFHANNRDGHLGAEFCRDLTVKDLILNGGGSSVSGLMFEGNIENIIVENCDITGAVWGIRVLCWGSSKTIAEKKADHYVKILNTSIHNIGEDGIYVGYTYQPVEIGYCSIYDVNRKYFGEFGGALPASQTTAPGDAIQIDSSAGSFPWIHHNVLDKSNTEFKFALILALSDGSNPAPEALVEYNQMIGQGRNTAAVVYLHTGAHVTLRGNVMSHAPNGVFNVIADGSLVVENNMFYDVNFAVTNQGGTGAEFYNNTLVDCGGMAWADFNKEQKLANNLMYVPTDTSADFLLKYAVTATPAAGRFASDYNLAYPERASMITFQGVAYSSLSAWTAAKGFDANSIAADPLFANYAEQDYRLAAGSPAKDAGMVIAGVTPEGDETPDIGANVDYLYTVAIGQDAKLPLMAFIDNGGGQEEVFWGPFTVTDYRYVDTEGWIGWLDSYATAPWFYNYNTGCWMYLPESQITENGAWSYCLP